MRCGNNNLFALHVCLASAASDAGDNLWEMVSTRGVARQKFGGGMDLGVTMNLGLFSFSLGILTVRNLFGGSLNR